MRCLRQSAPRDWTRTSQSSLEGWPILRDDRPLDDDDARGHIFPQRDEQLSCKSDDRCLPEATPIAPHALVEPATRAGRTATCNG
jgi:hypothetical protein